LARQQQEVDKGGARRQNRAQAVSGHLAHRRLRSEAGLFSGQQAVNFGDKRARLFNRLSGSQNKLVHLALRLERPRTAFALKVRIVRI
jgi:hypothetical protein